MTTTRKLLQTRRNNTHRTIREWITMMNVREQRTLTWGATSVVYQCGKVYKNHRGLQIHQTKSGCQICEKHQQSTYLPGNTGEIAIQVNRLAVSQVEYVRRLRISLRRTIIHSRVMAYICTCSWWTVDSKSSREKTTANCNWEPSPEDHLPQNER